MYPEQRAAFINSQTACMLVELEAMRAANRERESNGFSPAYGEDEFLALITRYGLHHNAVVSFLGGSQ